MASPTRPTVVRQSSRVPGGFDTDDDLSPIKTSFDDRDLSQPDISPGAQATPVMKSNKGDKGTLNQRGEDGDSMLIGENDTFLQEKEMRRRLEDMDSTFLQEVSPAARTAWPQTEDSPAIGLSLPHSSATPNSSPHKEAVESREHPRVGEEDGVTPESPATPPDRYRTPAPGRDKMSRDLPDTTAIEQGHYNTSALETMSSSPTAAAAARTVSRSVSMASQDGGYETADDSKGGIQLDKDLTPKKAHDPIDRPPLDDSPTPTKTPKTSQNPDRFDDDGTEDAGLGSIKSRKRPKYLNSRMASQHSSYSSYTTTSAEGGSDVTLGADFALQSGGAVPERSSIISSRPTDFSRSISLSSMASGISGLSDNDDKIKPSEAGLDTLDEEDDAARDDTLRAGRDPRVPQTPKSRDLNTPTDTVIAQHVKDVQVPATLAREYRDRQRQPSPEKRNGARNAKNLTLKEQSSTIDRLVKENFDLKLKITFLDEALSRRSDEEVKNIISENVDLRTAKFKSQKEMRELKRTLRDLERRLKEKSDELANRANKSVSENLESGHDSEVFRDLEDEVTYLRERITTYDVEIERMRDENRAQERDKKQLAEAVKLVGDTSRGTDVGAREEVVRMNLFRYRLWYS